MRNFNDLPIYFIITGLVVNIGFSIYANIPFTSLLIQCIVVIILFGILGYVTAEVLSSASKNMKKPKKADSEVADEVTTSSIIDIRTGPEDEDALLRALSEHEEEEDFIEIKPEDFKNFMNQE